MFNRSILREKNISWTNTRASHYAVGEIQLGFKLTVSNNNNDYDTLTNFNIWSMRLLNNMKYESMKKDVSKEIVEETLEFGDVLDEDELIDVLNIEDLEHDIELGVDSGDDDSIIDETDVINSIAALYGLDDISQTSSSSLSVTSSRSLSDSHSFLSLNSMGTVDTKADYEDEAQALAALDEFHISGSSDPSDSPESEAPTTTSSKIPVNKEDDGSQDEDDKKLLSKRGKRLPKRKRSVRGFEVLKREHSLGVVVLTLKKISNLPILRNRISKTNYDMDPFTIITFGRRVFRSSWKKHTLSPEYNEICAFEIYPDEQHFEFMFQVVDKDSFSYHDKVATASISWTDIISKYQINDVMNIDLPLELLRGTSDEDSHISISFQFLPYNELKRHFWTQSLDSLTKQNDFDIVELGVLLEQIGQFTSTEINNFFHHYSKKPWSHEKLTIFELVAYLENWTANNNSYSPFNNIQRCPICCHRVHKSRNIVNSKLNKENDLITHFAICQIKHKNSKRIFLKPSYVSIDFASRRWFSRMLIKLTYGKYALGSNNANILVQDRDSGIIIEEKISAHVRLGIRIIYNGTGVRSKKFKTILKRQTIKQGRKFDDPSSASYIPSFIKFHSLDLDDCVETKYETFNEFFYRKLKPGSRPPESQNPGILLSPADCRATVFPTISKAQEIWIKGRQFTVSKLLGNCTHHEQYTDHNSSIAIFRLAPQDYHRFHSPCEGVIGKIHHISGEYYTVNPMAIRTKLDVFGENVRSIIPITSLEFGTILYIAVGAMMVGSIILTCKEGDTVSRADELGYFKFGGSTIIMLIPHQKIVFDSDLVRNSDEMIETLLKVGMSVGHLHSIPEHPRVKRIVKDKEEIEKIKRIITVTDENASILHHVPWEYDRLQKLSSKERNHFT